jgi:hypothetical protein
MLQAVLNPAFWDRKFRIGVLALATFAAMC